MEHWKNRWNQGGKCKIQRQHKYGGGFVEYFVSYGTVNFANYNTHVLGKQKILQTWQKQKCWSANWYENETH